MIIEKLTVNGLFHKYNITLDFTRKLNVLLGANGTGKSTVLKMVKALQNEDFVELIRYEFDSIDIVTTLESHEKLPINTHDIDEVKSALREKKIKVVKSGKATTIHIEQEDLIPKIELLSDWYEVYFKAKYEFRRINNPGSIEDQKKYIQDVLNDIFLLLEDLYENKVIYKIIASAALDIPLSRDVKRLVEEKLEQFDIPKDLFFPEFDHFIKEMIIQQDGSVERYIRGCSVWDVFPDEMLEFDRISKVYVDLVKSIYFIEPELPQTVWNSQFLHWLNGIKKIHGPDDTFFSFFDKEYYHGCEHNLTIPYIIFENDPNKVILSIYKELLGKINDFTPCIYDDQSESPRYENIYWETMRKFLSSREYDINCLVSRNYYSDEFAKDQNIKGALFISDIAKGQIQYKKENESNYVTEVRDALKKHGIELSENIAIYEALKIYYSCVWKDIVDYIMPILCKDLLIAPSNIIRFLNETTVDLLFGETEGLSDVWAYYCFKFYEMIFDEFLDTKNRNPLIERLEKLAQKYFYDKRVVIVPSGIKVSTILKDGRETVISLNDLASGEKKILVLLSLALLHEDISLMLDEPELSLSIVWQESILTDLLEDSGIKNLTIATHSPYLVSKPELQEYIVFMPEEDAL